MTRRVWPWLRALIGSAILVALLARLGADAFLNGIRLIDGGTVAAALGITLVTTLLSALRWRLVARGLGLPLRPASAVADYYQAQFLNAVLPAGVLGDADRAVRHGRSAGDAGRAIRAVAMERAAGQLVLIVAAAAALLTQSSSVLTAVRDVLPGPEVAIAAAGALTALIALVAWNVRRKRPAILRRTLDDVHRGMLGRGIWPKLTILSAAVLAGYVSLFLVAARAAGSSAPILQLVPLVLPALLVMALPVNIGGWGPREAFTAIAFGAAGLDAAQGLTTAVLYGVLTLIASLPGGAVLILRRRQSHGQGELERQEPFPRPHPRPRPLAGSRLRSAPSASGLAKAARP